ncbi:MAG: hypothetical protein WBV28_13800 [Terracidiphilus sp.]
MLSRDILLLPSSDILRPAQQMPREFAPVQESSLIDLADADAVSQEMWDTVPQALGCMRAVRFALGIEAAAALAIYGLWHFVHMLR